MRIVLLALLLAGCASGITAVTPYTSPELEALRAHCLEQPSAVWMETTERARCVLPAPDSSEPERKT